MSEGDLAYHSERARRELELAARSEVEAAAAAHRQLAGLHMLVLKRQDELCGGASLERR